MADDPKKILVDDDWKAEARREKEKLTQETGKAREAMPPAGFIELVNMIVMNAMAGLGMMAGPGGKPIPPNLEVAKHFVDMLQVLEDKTKGNLNAEEKKLLDQVLYEMRMYYVQAAGGR
jgi:hypothetical protein